MWVNGREEERTNEFSEAENSQNGVEGVYKKDTEQFNFLPI